MWAVSCGSTALCHDSLWSDPLAVSNRTQPLGRNRNPGLSAQYVEQDPHPLVRCEGVDFGTQSDPTYSPPSRPVLVELRLGNGRCLRFDSSINGEALTGLIRAVEAV